MKWFLASFVLLASASACASGEPSPKKAENIAPPPVPSAEPIAVASAASSLETAPPAPPAPQILLPMDPPASLSDATQRDAFSVLSTLCEPATKKGVAGCACCAPFDSCKAHSGMTTKVDPDDFYGVGDLARGSFTGAGKDEIAITMDGCESHAENYGGIVVAERSGKGYVVARYDSGVHPNRMKARRMPDGHDMLVALWIDVHQSAVYRLFTYDFTASKPDDPTFGPTLLEVNDDMATSCTGIQPGGEAHEDSIDAYDLVDLDGDGALDLRALVTVRTTRETPAFKAICKKMFDDKPFSFDGIVRERGLRYDFLWRGKAFAAPTKQPAPPRKRPKPTP